MVILCVGLISLIFGRQFVPHFGYNLYNSFRAFLQSQFLDFYCVPHNPLFDPILGLALKMQIWCQNSHIDEVINILIAWNHMELILS